MYNMNKNIIGLALLTVSVYVAGAADEPQQIPSLRDLALQRVVQTMTSKEHAQRFARDPEQCEAYVESYGINRNGDIKNLIVEQLLRRYKNEIYCSKQLHIKRINSVDWHPNGELLALGAYDGMVHIWNVQTGEMLKVGDGRLILPDGGREDHRHRVLSVRWHPNGELLASGSDDETVCIWNGNTGQLLERLYGHQGWVVFVGWNPSGELLATGSTDKKVRIWDTCTGKVLCVLEGSSCSWHPSNGSLTLVSGNGLVSTWDTRTNQVLPVLKKDAYYPVAWHPNGELFTSGSVDQTTHIWNIQTGLEVTSLKHRPWVYYSAAWNSDGRLLASGATRGIHVWDMHAGKELDRLGDSNWIEQVVWHPHENVLAASLDHGAVHIWDIQAYDRLIDSVSLMQALWFTHHMEHADIMHSVADKGKEEEKEPMDDNIGQDFLSKSIRSFFGFDQIEQNLHALKGIGSSSFSSNQEQKVQAYMRDLEASLPDVLKRILQNNQE